MGDILQNLGEGAMEPDRVLQLERNYGELAGRIAVIQAELGPLKEGVSNFREFQRRGQRYFDRAEAVLDANEQRRKNQLIWLRILAPFILAIIGFFSYRWYNFTGDMMQIDHEWHIAHMRGKVYFYPGVNQ